LFQKTLFLREHATVYLLSVKILFANIKNNRVPASNDIAVTSFYFVNKSTVYFVKKVYCMNFCTVNNG